jgi:alpha-D-ribose 1-methylphosphonate 5-triphosphate diphosphatase
VTQPWSWEGGRHGPDAAEAALVALDAYRDRAGIDLRMQLCCDTHATDSGGRLLDAVRRHRVGNLRFRSVVHDALDLQHGDRAAFARLAAAAGIDERLYAAALRAARDRAPEVPRHLCRLAEAFDAMGVVYGSHADPDAETRERFSMIGARVAEMPQTRRVAATAKAVNDRVLLSASAVLGGKTEGAALPATEMIRAGLCDGLVAGDRLSSLPEAVWRLVDTGTLTLVRAWALVSSVPSEIQRLGDRGTIEAGRRADLVVIDAGTREVEATIAGGRLVHATESGTRRFAAVTPTRRLAAE